MVGGMKLQFSNKHMQISDREDMGAKNYNNFAPTFSKMADF